MACTVCMCDFSDWEDKRGAELTIPSSPPSERNSTAGTSLRPPVSPPSPSSKSLFLGLFLGGINQCTEGLCVLQDLILMYKFMRKGFQPHCNTIIYPIYFISMCVKFKQRLPMCCIILSAPLSKESMCSLCSSFIILVFEPSGPANRLTCHGRGFAVGITVGGYSLSNGGRVSDPYGKP